MVSRPELVFADEPTGNLDNATGKSIADLLFSHCRQSKATLILVTHDLKLAQRCQRAYTLDAGTLIEEKESIGDHSQ